MLGKRKLSNSLFQMVTLDQLVPKDHFLRQLDAAVDFSFVRELVAPLYCHDDGRPSVDPELALRMFVLGYLYNISENRLCEEISMHAGYRWFCGLDFHDAVPNRTTLVKLRRERWGPAGVFHKIMHHVVSQCIEAGLVSSDVIAIDGTQVRARAAQKSLEPIRPELSLAEYERSLDNTDEADSPEDKNDSNRGSTGGNRPPAGSTVRRKTRKKRKKRNKRSIRGMKFSNKTHRSITDPDARLYRKGLGKPAELSYIVNSTIDPKSGVILSTQASICTGSAEKEAAVDMIANIKRRGFAPKRVLLDGGYDAGAYLAAMMDMGVQPLVPIQGELKALPTWKTRPKEFLAALRRRQNTERVIALNEARLLYRSSEFRRTYYLRQRVEHTFAEGKEHHGLNRARGYGLSAMDIQAQLTATVQNLKRLVRLTRRKRPAPSGVAAMAVPKDHQVASVTRFFAKIATWTVLRPPSFAPVPRWVLLTA